MTRIDRRQFVSESAFLAAAAALAPSASGLSAEEKAAAATALWAMTTLVNLQLKGYVRVG